jgi:hypothetical protein
MILMWENPISRALEGEDLENQAKLVPFGPTKSRFSGPSLILNQIMDLPPSKSLSPSRYIGNFKYMRFAAAV